MHGDVNVDAELVVGARVNEELIVRLGREVQVQLAKEEHQHQQPAQHRDCGAEGGGEGASEPSVPAPRLNARKAGS
jgi:hypothetical protein